MMTGTVGLKPANGSLPMGGIFPLAPTLDTVGPIARAVDDITLIMNALLPRADLPSIGSTPRPVRIGHIRHFWDTDLAPAPDVREAMQACVDSLADNGMVVADVHLPALQVCTEAAWCILLYEAYAVHRHELASENPAYGAATLHLLEQGARIPAQDYRLALDCARHVGQAVNEALASHDALLGAVSSLPACRTDDRDALAALDAASARIPFNLTGHAALATPVGVSTDGLPISCQWITRQFHDLCSGGSGALLRYIARTNGQLIGKGHGLQ